MSESAAHASFDSGQYAVRRRKQHKSSNRRSGSDFYTIKPVKNVPGGTIADISAGYDHTLILMENGDLYGIGNNAYGQLGSEGLGGTVGSFTKIASAFPRWPQAADIRSTL